MAVRKPVTEDAITLTDYAAIARSVAQDLVSGGDGITAAIGSLGQARQKAATAAEEALRETPPNTAVAKYHFDRIANYNDQIDRLVKTGKDGVDEIVSRFKEFKFVVNDPKQIAQ